MRGTRWLLLVAIAAIIFGVGVTYQEQKKANQKNALAAPAPLADDVSSALDRPDMVHKDQKTGCIIWELSPKDMRQAADSSHSELTDVRLKLYHNGAAKCGDKFDLVRSAAATYFDSEGRLYAEGAVEITLGEPIEGEAPASLVSITTSGVTFDINTGKSDTDSAAEFVFKNGAGHSTGATYDPPSKELLMKHDVVVDWQPATPHAKALHIEAPSLQYHENTAEIDLAPTGRMTRGDLIFEGETPIIRLRDDGAGHKFIREIDADHAHGTDNTPNRKLSYAGDRVWVFYNDDHLIQRIVVEGDAAMTSTAETSETQVAANHVEMYFDPHDKESQLTRVVCNGKAVVASKPLPAAGRQPAESHVLRAENIEMQMRPGGREIQTVAAHPSGVLEFLPNLPAQHHRTLRGDQMLISYAPKNRIEAFHATNVTTTTDPNADELKRHRAVSTTSSKDFSARFDPQTSQLIAMEQTGNFTYQEGDRKAHANKAAFDQKQNVMTLDSGAAVSDATGSTAADHIRLDQATGDFLAEGNVSSTRLPDKSQKGDSAMLSGDAPMNAQAGRMESTNRAGNHHTHYQGNVKLWQGANRIGADMVEIDRDKHTLVADGHVVTEAWEQPKDDKKKAGGAAVLTKVYAPHLVYTDGDRLAFYSGGVKLDRPDLHLKSQELHAWLADSKADSQLEKAFADGAVEIAGARKDNAYDGTSEHAEYYTGEQKVVLNGGTPQLTRTAGGKQPTVIKQAQLIYFVNDGKLVGTGAAADRIPPKKK
jgi:lipopolysaccharide export system protein LptA